jgi:hypothetical protein
MFCDPTIRVSTTQVSTMKKWEMREISKSYIFPLFAIADGVRSHILGGDTRNLSGHQMRNVSDKMTS